jgi:hypothetical protein
MHPYAEYDRFAHLVNDEFREQLNKKSMKYNWHDAKTTLLEGVFARGDRRLSAVVLEAYKLGCLYDAWSETFDYDKWVVAFANVGMDMDFYTTRKRELDEVFPWDFIDIGVTKDFLVREWHEAIGENVTPNCREKCSGCGARSFGGGVCFES